MEQEDIRAAIVVMLSAMLPSVGIVQNRERTSMVSYRESATPKPGVIRAVTVSNADPGGKNSLVTERFDTCTVRLRRVWTLRYYLTIDDKSDSESACWLTVERIRKLFTKGRSLGGSVVDSYAPDVLTFVALNIEEYDVHYVEIVFQTVSYENVAGGYE